MHSILFYQILSHAFACKFGVFATNMIFWQYKNWLFTTDTLVCLSVLLNWTVWHFPLPDITPKYAMQTDGNYKDKKVKKKGIEKETWSAAAATDVDRKTRNIAFAVRQIKKPWYWLDARKTTTTRTESPLANNEEKKVKDSSNAPPYIVKNTERNF